MDITKIDKNFIVETKIEQPDLKFYNALEKPFKIYGVFYENGKFRRMPEDVAKAVSYGVWGLHSSTAGGRIRFRTDSPYIVVNAKMPPINKMPHFALTGHCGFDMYITEHGEKRYFRTFIPPVNIDGGFESLIWLPEAVLTRDIEINFPLYTDVNELYIGIKEGSTITEHKPYKYEKPIVYYGSSITQGGCASRPGTCYQSIVSRHFDANYINLGFSGSAKAEPEMIEYIKGLDMSVFVYDYDHNAPTTEHLKETHEKSFKIIREANPNLPIIMMPRPKGYQYDWEKEREEIIKTTYLNAVNSGDKNVYFISSKELTAICGNEGTVDDSHPTDLGFYSMAQAVIKVLKEILK